MVPYSKVGDKGPLLHGLVISGLTPHKAQVKGQTRMVRTHDHGGQGGGWDTTTATISIT